MEKATFAGGCFWCTEAIFKRLKGVESVVSGYSGGDKENPSYEEVSLHATNHAEAVQITFDPDKISYDDLLYVFLKTHDPTTLNKQGGDVGPQYRSEIFYHGVEQEKKAKEAIKTAQKEYGSPIVTKVSEYKNFFEAESNHQDYYEKNKSAGYCRVVIDPKIKKLEKDFKQYLK